MGSMAMQTGRWDGKQMDLTNMSSNTDSAVGANGAQGEWSGF